MNETMLSIIGTFIGLGLALNAYFIKGLIEKLTEVQISTAVAANKILTLEVNNTTNAGSIVDLYKRYWELKQGMNK